MPTISHHELRQLIRSEAIERHLDLAASAARSSEHNGWLRRSRRRLLLLGGAAPVLAVLASMIGSADAVPRIREAAGTLAALPTVATSDPLRSAISPPASSHPRPGSPTVVLDAGHGGSSHGAEVSSGLKEKDINLDVGLRLRSLLEARGYEVLMTRQDDRDLPLEERVALANDRGADVFLSIHVNWMTQPDIRAIETFFRTESTPGSESTRRQDETRSVHGGDSAPRISSSQSEDSRLLAEAVQSELLRYLRSLNPNIRDRGVKSARFAVLDAARMPAILTEVSCLSNEDDARLLERASYRQYVAEALSAGIERFVESRRTRGRDA